MFSSLTSLFSNPLGTIRNKLLLLPAILIGLTVHEWAHAFAADKAGDPTAKEMGRLSFNPLDHLDPVGFACLLLLGFGWAKPVPVNTRNFRHFKRDDLIVSLAGIAMNLIAATVFSLLTYALLGFFPALLGNEAFLTIMFGIVSVNLSLMFFNLIPLYPLDGSRVFENLFFSKIPKVCMFLRSYGRYIMLACFVLGIFSTILSPLVSVVYNAINRLGFALFSLILSLR